MEDALDGDGLEDDALDDAWDDAIQAVALEDDAIQAVALEDDALGDALEDVAPDELPSILPIKRIIKMCNLSISGSGQGIPAAWILFKLRISFSAHIRTIFLGLLRQ